MAGKEFNPYEILGVGNDTADEDIKKQYKSRSKELHPDKGGSSEDFANLKKAFDILIDPAKRNLYDEYGLDNFINIETEARLVATQIVISALDGLPDSCDLDKEISAIFQRCLDGLTAQELQAKQLKERLQRRLDAVQKKPVNDFLTDEITKVIDNHNKAMKQAQLNYQIHNTAFKMVQDYQFDITKIPFMGDSDIGNNTMASRVNRFGQAQRDLYKSLGIRSS
jgi:curved DNA-binding protein CbpA